MEIKNERLFDDSIKSMASFALERLKEKSKVIINEVKADLLPVLDDFIKDISGENKGQVFGMEVEELDLATLVTFAKDHIVQGSNEIVAIRNKDNDEYFIYLAYSFERQVFDPEKNRYLIIKAKSLTEEVNNLFNESELIILK